MASERSSLIISSFTTLALASLELARENRILLISNSTFGVFPRSVDDRITPITCEDRDP